MNTTTPVTKIEDVLVRKGYRRSHARRTLLAVLADASHSLAQTDVIAQVVKQNINRSSAYRGLEILIRENIVNTTLKKGETHYELSQPHSTHHHHLNCFKCGNIVSVYSPKLEAVIKAISEKHGFTAHSHTFEITGICSNCHLKSN